MLVGAVRVVSGKAQVVQKTSNAYSIDTSRARQPLSYKDQDDTIISQPRRVYRTSHRRVMMPCFFFVTNETIGVKKVSKSQPLGTTTHNQVRLGKPVKDSALFRLRRTRQFFGHKTMLSYYDKCTTLPGFRDL